MANTLFTNVNVFDGTSPVLYPAEVLVQGNRIKEVARGDGKQLQRDGVEEVDCGGATLMPGPHQHTLSRDLYQCTRRARNLCSPD